jgi:hypothetical protein
MNTINQTGTVRSKRQIDLQNVENGDIVIDIFKESLNEYVRKLNAAAKGKYELDDYDMQVIAVAMDQFASQLKTGSNPGLSYMAV